MRWLIRRGLSMVFAASAALLSTMTLAAPADPPFCIVPILDGAPTEADYGTTWRIINTTFNIPGLPGPVFKPLNRPGLWTINRDRRLVPYVGAFPANRDDKWTKEPWSGRVVGVPSVKGVPVVLDPGDRTFEQIHSPDSRDRGFSGPFMLPRWRQTIIISGWTNTVLATQDRSLRPWLSPRQMKMVGLDSIEALHDASSLSATIVLGHVRGERKRLIYVLADDDTWHSVASLPEDDFGGEVIDAPGSAVALLRTAKTVFAIRNHGPAASPRYSAETLQQSTSGNIRSVYHVSNLFGQVLAFAPRARWARLTPAGAFKDIPGGEIGLVTYSDSLPEGRIQDLPTLRRTLIEGRDGLFLYDGTRIVSVPDSTPDRIGKYPRVYDLPSIGRVIVSTRHGLFELDREGRLVARPMPFATEGSPWPEFIDWPAAGVALASTKRGLFVVSREWNASEIPGGDQVELGFGGERWETNMATGEIILIGRRGLFLAVEGRREGAHTCRRFLETVSRIPNSDICLKPTPGRDARSIGFPVDDRIEPPRVSLPESLRSLLPAGAHALATLDAGSGEVLFATTAGLFVTDGRGNTRRLGGTAGLRAVRTLAFEPGTRHVLAGGDGGLFRITAGSLDVEPLDNGTSDIIGAVNRIVDASFAGASIIEASNGTYALENGRLSIIRDLAAASRMSSVYAFPHLRRLLAKDQGDEPLLYEAGRRDSTSICSRPISDQ